MYWSTHIEAAGSLTHSFVVCLLSDMSPPDTTGSDGQNTVVIIGVVAAVVVAILLIIITVLVTVLVCVKYKTTSESGRKWRRVCTHSVPLCVCKSVPHSIMSFDSGRLNHAQLYVTGYRSCDVCMCDVI